MPSETIAPMTDDELRIKVAELCGWKSAGHVFDKNAGYIGIRGISPQTENHWMDVPDYANDLNAMHEAENSQSDDWHRDYYWALQEVTLRDKTRMHRASARQRAEAFVAAMSK